MKNLLIIKEKDPSILEKAVSLKGQERDVAILLMLDSVFMVSESGEYSDTLKRCMDLGVKIYLLEGDVVKRGIRDSLLEGLTLVDFNGMVDLLFEEKQRVLNL